MSHDSHQLYEYQINETRGKGGWRVASSLVVSPIVRFALCGRLHLFHLGLMVQMGRLVVGLIAHAPAASGEEPAGQEADHHGQQTGGYHSNGQRLSRVDGRLGAGDVLGFCGRRGRDQSDTMPVHV